MAKVVQPLGSTEARGRVGGLVYNTWRGISTVKRHTDPAHEDDPLRQQHKLRVQLAGQRWRTLTEDQRSAWRAWARDQREPHWTGVDKILPGYHWYVRINTRLQDLGLDWRDWPPDRILTNHIWNLRASAEIPDLVVQWNYPTPPPLPSDYIDIWLCGPHSPGRHPTLHDAHRAYVEIAADQEAVLTIVQQGRYTIWARLISVQGITSPFQSTYIDVV